MTAINKLQKIFEDIFYEYKISQDTIRNLSRENFSNWDSMKHLEVIFKVSEEFNIEFSVDDVVDLRSFQEILKVIQSK